MDTSFPDGEGIDLLVFLERMQKGKKGKKIPVITISVISVQKQKEMYKLFDVLAHFQKPIDKIQILGLCSLLPN